jgi:hypothetical protein
MKWDSVTWVFVTGKAFTGKTFFIRKHIEALPKSRMVAIYDFTREYEDLAKKKNIQVWQVRRGTKEEIEEFTSKVFNRGNCTVVYSESDNYLAMNSDVLLAMVTTGRNRGINAIVDGKRPMSVKPSYRGRFNKLILFQTSLPADIEYIEDWTGQGRGSFEMLKTLGQGEFIEADLDLQTVSEVQKL